MDMETRKAFEIEANSQQSLWLTLGSFFVVVSAALGALLILLGLDMVTRY